MRLHPHPHLPRPRPALLYGMIALMVLIWTGNFIAAKIAFRYLDPITLAPLRVELAALIMLAVFVSVPNPEPSGRDRPGPDGKSSRTPFDRKDFWTYFLLGLFGVAGNQMLFLIGLNYTTVGHSSLIIGAGPITILLLARAQRLELLTVSKLFGMVLSFSGVALLALEKGISLHTGNLKGDLITLSGSLSFACYTILSKKIAPRYDTISMNFYLYVAGAAIVLPLAIWRGLRLDWAAVGWQGWLGLLYLAVFGSVVAYLIFFWALRHLAASRLAAFTYFQPILATLLGVAVLGEELTHNLLGGGALVLVGVYLAERMPRRARVA
ncbi:MAG: DMT family transporter [Acidobacteria bacterium]|nr:DMT family transporter [Acidobacteriota bacterium]MBI3664175.1 DMT family transporter [Acidobacteriota bacterium]